MTTLEMLAVGAVSLVVLAVLFNRADAWMIALAKAKDTTIERIKAETTWPIPLLLIGGALLVAGVVVEFGLARSSLEAMDLGALSPYMAAIVTSCAFIAGVWWDHPFGASTVGGRRTHRAGAVLLFVICMATLAFLAYYRANQTAGELVTVPAGSTDSGGPVAVVQDSGDLWALRIVSVGLSIILSSVLFLFGRLAAPIMYVLGVIVQYLVMVILWIPWRIRALFTSNKPKVNPFRRVKELLTDPTPVNGAHAAGTIDLTRVRGAGSTPVR